GRTTAPARLASLAQWQRRIADLPGVQAVVGPARVSRAVAPLRRQGKALLGEGPGPSPLGNVGRVGRSLARATAGVSQVRGGLAEAADGARLLAEGCGGAEAGARALARGLGRVTGGTRRLIDALEAFEAGTQKLAQAQHKVVFGNIRLKTALHELVPILRRNGLRLSRATQRSLNES